MCYKNKNLKELDKMPINTTEVIWSPENYSIPTTMVKKRSLKNLIFKWK